MRRLVYSLLDVSYQIGGCPIAIDSQMAQPGRLFFGIFSCWPEWIVLAGRLARDSAPSGSPRAWRLAASQRSREFERGAFCDKQCRQERCASAAALPRKQRAFGGGHVVVTEVADSATLIWLRR
jgi:hypothetical protein